MINYFAILLTHGLIGWLCWQLMLRDDVDADPGANADPGADATEEAAHRKPPSRLRTRRDA